MFLTLILTALFFSEFCVTAAVDVKNVGLYVFAFLLLTSAYKPQIWPGFSSCSFFINCLTKDYDLGNKLGSKF